MVPWYASWGEGTNASLQRNALVPIRLIYGYRHAPAWSAASGARSARNTRARQMNGPQGGTRPALRIVTVARPCSLSGEDPVREERSATTSALPHGPPPRRQYL